MDFKADFDENKFKILTLLVCIVFFILIIKAFQYIPDTKVEPNFYGNLENVNRTVENQMNSNQNQEDNGTKTEDIHTITQDVDPDVQDISTTSNSNNSNIDDVQPIEDNQDNANAADNVQTILLKAKTAQNNKNYSQAIEYYKSIPNMTSDQELIAQSYENMAVIYATNKRYGSALSLIQKAYNLAPTSYREMLLAKIYYKSGDISNATKRINNVLKRDFSTD